MSLSLSLAALLSYSSSSLPLILNSFIYFNLFLSLSLSLCLSLWGVWRESIDGNYLPLRPVCLPASDTHFIPWQRVNQRCPARTDVTRLTPGCQNSITLLSLLPIGWMLCSGISSCLWRFTSTGQIWKLTLWELFFFCSSRLKVWVLFRCRDNFCNFPKQLASMPTSHSQMNRGEMRGVTITCNIMNAFEEFSEVHTIISICMIHYFQREEDI